MIFRKADIIAIVISAIFIFGAFYIVSAGAGVGGGGAFFGNCSDSNASFYCLSYGSINAITPNSFLLGSQNEVTVYYSFGTETDCANVTLNMKIDTYLDGILVSTNNLSEWAVGNYTASQQVPVIELAVGMHSVKMVFTDLNNGKSIEDIKYFEITGTPESCVNNQPVVYLSPWTDPANYPGLVCYFAYISTSLDSNPANETIIADDLPCAQSSVISWTGAQSGAAYHDFVRYKAVRIFSDDFEQAGTEYTNGWTTFTDASVGHRMTPTWSTTGKKLRLQSKLGTDPDNGAQQMFTVGSFQKIKIDYRRKTTSSAEPGSFNAEYSFDGSNFTNLETLTGDTPSGTVSFWVSNPGNTNIWFRFYVNGPTADTFVAYIDNVSVFGEYDGVINKGPLIRSNSFTAPVCSASGAAPVANATISKDGVNYSNLITVVQGVPTRIYLAASSGGGVSSDPDVWTAALGGVSSGGGKCEWNRDLDQGSPPSFEPPPIMNPNSPADCNISLGSLTFNDPVGTIRTYEVLKITDNGGLSSNIDFVQVKVDPPGASNNPPIANAGNDMTVDENTSASIVSESISDPDGDALTYTWSCNGGSVSPSSGTDSPPYNLNAAYNAPLVSGTDVYTCTLNVSDGSLSDSDTTQITVNDTAAPPEFELSIGGPIIATIIGGVFTNSTKTTVKVNADAGFSDTVNLSFSLSNPNLPGPAQHVFTDIGSSDGNTLGTEVIQPEYLTGSFYNVRVPQNTDAGTYDITLRGRSGSINKFADVILTVEVRDPGIIEVLEKPFKIFSSLEPFDFLGYLMSVI